MLAVRHEAAAVDLLVEGDEAGDVARRAGLFDPEPTVWAIEDTTLTPATAAELTTVEPPALEPAISSVLDMPEVRTVVEHGVVTGECRGVEVARVTGQGPEQRLDVGVGAYDQGAFAVMNPELSDQESLAEVVAQVLTERRRGAEPHPLNRLVRERWLRAELLDDPSSLGIGELDPVEGPIARDGLHDVAPAFAVSRSAGTLVACSVGIDLDLVPAAAEVARRENAERIVLVLPARDQHPITRAVADRCRYPIDVVTADEPWPTV